MEEERENVSAVGRVTWAEMSALEHETGNMIGSKCRILTAHRTGIGRSDLIGISSHDSGVVDDASIHWKSASGCMRIGISRLRKLETQNKKV